MTGVGVLLLALFAIQEPGMKDLIDRLDADEVEVRSRASEEILSGWRRWTLEDLRLLEDPKSGGAEVASRSKNLLIRLRIRRTLGETLLQTLPMLENTLLSKNEDQVLEALDRAESLSKNNGIDGADMVSLLRWLSEEKWSDRVQERIRALNDKGFIADPRQLLPMLQAVDPLRRQSALESLATLRARPLAGDIVPLLKDPYPDVRHRAAEALVLLRARGEEARIAALLREKSPLLQLQTVDLLGDLGARSSADAVIPFLKDPVPTVRVRAIRALAKMRARDYAPQLVPVLADGFPGIGNDAAEALGALENPEVVPAIKAMLDSKDVGTRVAAAYAIGCMEVTVPELLPLLKDPDPEARQKAVRALGRAGDRSAAAEIRPLLKDEIPWVRAAAVEAIGRLGGKDDENAVLALSKDPDVLVQERAWVALGTMGAVGARKALKEALNQGEPRIRAAALQALGRIPDSVPEDAVRALLTDADALVRETALDALMRSDSRTSGAAVRELLRDPEPRVRKKAAEALEVLDQGGDPSDLLRLLEDPNPWIRARVAAELGRLGSRLPAGKARDRWVPALRAAEKDPHWEVEASADIALLLLGLLDRPAQRQLVEEFMATGISCETRLTLDLLDALSRTHERESYERFVGRKPVSSMIVSLDDLRKFLRGSGLDLKVPAAQGTIGSIPEGSLLSPREAVDRLLNPRGVRLSGGIVILSSWQESLGAWIRRLEN